MIKWVTIPAAYSDGNTEARAEAEAALNVLLNEGYEVKAESAWTDTAQAMTFVLHKADTEIDEPSSEGARVSLRRFSGNRGSTHGD